MKRILALSFVSSMLLLFSCKKDKITAEDELLLQTESVVNANDQVRLQNDDEEFGGDATVASDMNADFAPGTNGGPAVDSASIPGGVIDKSDLGNKRIIIRYLGKNILGAIRNGKITIELVKGNRWILPGSIIKQTFDSCAVTKGGKTFIFNGVRYVTNVNGGLLIGGLQDTIIHKIRVVGKVTYDDKTIADWWAARLNMYVKSKGIFSSNGDSTIANENCSMGGVTRVSKGFLVKSPQAIVASKTCGWGKPYTGKRIINTNSRTVTITYGVDDAGNQVASGCASGYKVEWTKYNQTNGVVIVKY